MSKIVRSDGVVLYSVRGVIYTSLREALEALGE